MFNWVFNGFENLLSNVFPEKHHQSNIHIALKDHFVSTNEPWIKEQINSFIKHDTRVLIKQLNTERALNPFAIFTMTLQSKLRECLSEFDYHEAEIASPPYLDSRHFELKLQQIIRKNLIAFGFLNGTTNKFIAAKTGKNVPPSLITDNRIKTWIAQTMKTVNGKSTLKSYYSQTAADELLKALCQEEISRGNQSVIREDKTGYYFKNTTTSQGIKDSVLNDLFGDKDEQFVNDYLPYTYDNLDRAVLTEFTSEKFAIALKETKLKHLITLHRGLTRQTYTFKSDDFNAFFANIRFCKRIQKRRMRQACEDEQSDKINGEKFQSSWEFGDNSYVALESQEIGTNLSRTDLVVNLGSYKAIYDRLKPYEAFHHKIADWMIKGILFDAKALALEFENNNVPIKVRASCNKIMVDLFYLMLGCEVQRNPASLLTNLITLTLIAENQISWEEALASPEYVYLCGGGVSPMSMGKYIQSNKTTESKPVQCARALQSHYGLFAIKNDRYDDGPKANESSKSRDLTHIKELVRREKEMIKKGLLFNKEKNQSACDTLTELRSFIPST